MATPPKLKNNLHYLKVLSESKPAARTAILENADKELIDCICEAIDNILRGNVKIPTECEKKLRRHAKVLKQLGKKSTGIKTRRQLLVQKGGFLPAILGPLIGIASGLISGLVR